jgi:ABC-type multidrug transport system fused ATPase/permease subunit
MNNVRYAKLDATDEEVYEACKAASIHEQILGFSEGIIVNLFKSEQAEANQQ